MKTRVYKLLLLLLLPSVLTISAGKKRKRDSFSLLDNKRQQIQCITILAQAIKDNDIRGMMQTFARCPFHLRSTLLHAPDPFEERLPLELACAYSSKKAVELLLKHGANPIISDRQERTPLKTSIYRGSPNIVKLLLHNSSLQNPPEGRPSPLGLAVIFQNTCYYKIAKLLLQAGADPNLRDYSGQSPYMRAAVNGHRKLLLFMNLYGADPLKPSKQEKSALEYASCARNYDIARSMELKISKDEEQSIRNLLERQPDDLITGESLLSYEPSQLIILNNKLYTKDFLIKHVLHKIGTINGPRDPFINTPILKATRVRLAAYTGIPYPEIDHTKESPDNNSLVAIARRLVPRESVLSSINNNSSDSNTDTESDNEEENRGHYDRETYELIQGEIRLLKTHFSDRLRLFNSQLTASMYPPIIPDMDILD